MKIKPLSASPSTALPNHAQGSGNLLGSVTSVHSSLSEEPPVPFKRPWWLFNSHLETLYSNARCARIRIEYEHEEVLTPDSDSVLFHYISGETNRPMLILFHGLEGNSSSPSIKMIVHHFQQRGWSVVIPHFRTCGTMNRLPRAYHAGDADEIEWMVKYASKLIPVSRIHAAGISLGGNALIKFLGDKGQNHLASAAAICAPMDLSACARCLESWPNSRIYSRQFLETLLLKVQMKLQKYPFLVDQKLLAGIRTIREFDNMYTAPIHGFKNAEDYYRKSSARHSIAMVSTSLLCINPINDPLVPYRSIPRQADVPSCVRMETPRHGGHLAFVAGRKGFDWLPKRLESFFTVT